jgi:hypothetical protein
MKIMAANAESIGLDVNAVEDEDLLEIQGAVGEDLSFRFWCRILW